MFEKVSSELEHFVVPGLPDRVELTKCKVAGFLNPGDGAESSPMKSFIEQIRESDKAAFGIVANTFEELEPEYVRVCKGKG